MSKARDHALAHRLVLASLTSDDDAFARVIAELDPDACRRATAMLADSVARVLTRLSGTKGAIHEVENLIWARLDEMDAELG